MSETKKFKQAQNKIVTFLGSREFKEQEDAQSTQSSVPILQQIIKLGYITDNSQEGVVNNGYNNETKKYFREEERAYVSGFMQSEKARKFIEWINTYTEKVALIVFNEPSEEFYNLFISDAYIPSIAQTISGTSKSPIIHNNEMHIYSKAMTVLPSRLIEFQKEQVYLNGINQVEYIYCFDPVYGRLATSNKGLYNDVLNALENI